MEIIKRHKPDLPDEKLLRSNPAVIVCYPNDALVVAHLRFIEPEEYIGGSPELDSAYRSLTKALPRVEKRTYYVEDEHGAQVNPKLVAWIDADSVVRRILEDFPLRNPSIYESLRFAFVGHHYSCLGMAGAGKTPARAKASRLNGKLGGRLPKDPIERKKAIALRERLREERATAAAEGPTLSKRAAKAGVE